MAKCDCGRALEEMYKDQEAYAEEMDSRPDWEKKGIEGNMEDLLKLLNSMYPKQWKCEHQEPAIIKWKCPVIINNAQKKIIDLSNRCENYYEGKPRRKVGKAEYARTTKEAYKKGGYEALVLFVPDLYERRELTEFRINKFMKS